MREAPGNRTEDLARDSAAPLDTIGAGLFKGLAAVGAAIGTPPPLVRSKILDLLARRSKALDSSMVPESVRVAAAKLCNTIEALMGEIAPAPRETAGLAPRGNGARAC